MPPLAPAEDADTAAEAWPPAIRAESDTEPSDAWAGQRPLAAAGAPLAGRWEVEPQVPPGASRPDRLALLRSRLDRAIQAGGGAALAAAPALPPSGRVAGAGTAAPAADPLPGSHVTTQVVRAVLLSWRDGVGEARVRLEPESLGTLTVVLRVERGTVTATVSSEAAAVRESIQAHERDLRAGLAEHGLELGRLVVTDDRPGRDGAREQEPRPWRSPRRSGRQASARFEIEA